MDLGYTTEAAIVATVLTIVLSMAAFLRLMKRPVPVLLITDIGRDIDDTLALLALVAYQRQGLAELVGVIATGGMGKDRARLTRGWLRRLGVGDHVPVAACDKSGREVCDTESFETPDEKDAALYGKPAGDLILQLANEHKGKLQIFAVAPLSSLADAISSTEGMNIVRKGVACLNIQGQATVENNVLKPDFQAFNLSENKTASEAVFEKLQRHIPFRLLGKHAAYRVSLTRQDFLEWDKLLVPQGCLIRSVKKGLEGLKEKMPQVFDRLYPLPADKRDTPEWFESIEVVSHPYDPLLVVSFFNSDMFRGDNVRVKRKSAIGFWPFPSWIRHVIIGSTNDGDCGVPQPEIPYQELKRAVSAGIIAKPNTAN